MHLLLTDQTTKERGSELIAMLVVIPLAVVIISVLLALVVVKRRKVCEYWDFWFPKQSIYLYKMNWLKFFGDYESSLQSEFSSTKCQSAEFFFLVSFFLVNMIFTARAITMWITDNNTKDLKFQMAPYGNLYLGNKR